jgi:exopolyphosphatase/guanosine-5'-triphosphate,3'-diphosphate pyrophosphatase
VRDADNGEAFLGEIEWSYGFATQLLTGDEEAALTLRGVGPLEPGTVIVDIGGGSTELIADGFRQSLDLGCVRLTERHHGDLDALAAAVRAELPELHAERVLNVDGTTAEIAHHAGEVTRAAIDEMLAWLTSAPEDEIRASLLQADRSEVLAAGVVILREVLDRLGVDRSEPSARDLLNGAALVAAELPEPDEGAAPPGAFTCC